MGQLSPDLLEILDNSIQNPIVTCFCDDDITDHQLVRQGSIEDRSGFLAWVRAKDTFDLPLFVDVESVFDERLSDLFFEYRQEKELPFSG